MKKLVGAAILGLMGAFLVSPADAQEVATQKTRVRFVRAFCSTGPCTPAIDFEFGGGHINRMIFPKPLSKRKIGKLRLRGVMSTPLPSSLEAQVTARFVYDTVDPDGDCPDLGSDVVQVLATSSMFCKQQIDRATCGGDLLTPVGLFDTRCTDVRVTLHDLDFEIYEFGMVGVLTSKIATQGVSVVGKTPDCSSGGFGCP